RATHVPFIVAAPGVTTPGSRCPRPVSLIDLYPTLTDLTGLPPRAGVEGTSLKPLLRDPRRQWERPALITYFRGNHALRSERWSYIRYHDGGEELYDRQQDPHEWVNLASGNAAVKRDLARWLPQHDAPDARPSADFVFDPSTVKWTRR
ncbi:MAG: sulfatase/phosphatase domain-containing protein, partial [Bryobacteraceae bacterium]